MQNEPIPLIVILRKRDNMNFIAILHICPKPRSSWYKVLGVHAICKHDILNKGASMRIVALAITLNSASSKFRNNIKEVILVTYRLKG